MLETYLIEIVVAGLILLIVVAFLVMKKSKTGDNEEEIVRAVNDPYEALARSDFDKERDREKKEKQNRDFEQKDREFEESMKPKQEVVKEAKKVAVNRVRREAPHHETKIVKGDFAIFEGSRILVAEDNPINQKVLAGLLASSGIELIMADDGQIALEILAKDINFNMVLMDAHMPNVDGFEATRAIRANSNYDHIAVVALSGDTASDDIRKMTEAGMEKHLEKPIRLDALYDIIYSYTGETDSIVPSTPTNTISREEINYSDMELDTTKGIATCGGDEHFYKEILTEFVNNYSSSPGHLNRLFDENKLDDADKLLLDIAGLSANIGADKLYKTIQQLKEELRISDEATYRATLQIYAQNVASVLGAITEYESSSLMM